MAKHRTQEKNLYFTLAIFVKYPKHLDHAPLCPVKNVTNMASEQQPQSSRVL